jgi:hypothetical protein
VETVQINIINTLGTEILTLTGNIIKGKNTFEINTTGFTSGIYLVQIRTGNITKVHRVQVTR